VTGPNTSTQRRNATLRAREAAANKRIADAARQEKAQRKAILQRDEDALCINDDGSWTYELGYVVPKELVPTPVPLVSGVSIVMSRANAVRLFNAVISSALAKKIDDLTTGEEVPA
jgi:hypothetical protein